MSIWGNKIVALYFEHGNEKEFVVPASIIDIFKSQPNICCKKKERLNKRKRTRGGKKHKFMGQYVWKCAQQKATQW